MSLTTDRARRHTAAEVLRRIDDDTFGALLDNGDGSPAEVRQRLAELDHAWDLDRMIEVEASLVGLMGLALGARIDRRFLGLSVLASGGVFLYATRGFYPLLPLFRRLGIRTSREISRERYALKALRGDFAGLESDIQATGSSLGLGSSGGREQAEFLELKTRRTRNAAR
jgi:hypothetical protein